MRFILTLIAAALAGSLCASAEVRIGSDVVVHGSIQADALIPDSKTKAENNGDEFLTNDYATLSVLSKYVEGGLRVEYLKHPLPGFNELGFKGWGVPNIYLKGRYKGVELTVGDFYEQFGAGFILRTYEERSLGIDNSLRGARVKVSALKGLSITALGGLQRRYWDWNKHSQVYGADVEFNFSDYVASLQRRNITWTVAGSYVLKHEDDAEIIVPDMNARLNLPTNVGAVDFRTHFYRSGLDLQAEFAYKRPDPSFDNNYTYASGTAFMLSGSYSKPGWSALLQLKRSENMAFRSQRSQEGLGSYINNLPPFAYQHTYTLAAFFPYATQAAPGEYAVQGAFAYSFRRGTALGGKYGTKLRFNGSYVCGIDNDKYPYPMGTDGSAHTSEGFGETYYTDLNLQLEKKLSKSVNINAMYMFQKYNRTVVEGHGGMVNSNILVGEAKWRMSRKLTLRGELQYMFTNYNNPAEGENGDWCAGLIELSINPYFMISASDTWNCGNDTDKKHFYMFSFTANYRSNRFMVGYGRTRAGFNCAGGVCRYVPQTRGFTLSYNYNF